MILIAWTRLELVTFGVDNDSFPYFRYILYFLYCLKTLTFFTLAMISFFYIFCIFYYFYCGDCQMTVKLLSVDIKWLYNIFLQKTCKIFFSSYNTITFILGGAVINRKNILDFWMEVCADEIYSLKEEDYKFIRKVL